MNLKRILVATGLALAACVALAQTPYYGYNPVTGMQATNGYNLRLGAPPAVSGCSVSGIAGGSSAGKVVAGATSCTLVFTFPLSTIPPNRWQCTVRDITTTSDSLAQNGYTVGSATVQGTCTVTGTVAVNDVLIYAITGF